MDWFAELWATAKQAGPFASLILLVACYTLYQQLQAKDEKHEAELNAVKADYEKRLETLGNKYDAIIGRFITLASDTHATLQDWKDFVRQPLVKDVDK